MISGGWGALYALLITATGWTWDHIADTMTLPRMNALSTYWREFPPVHVSAALFFGIGKSRKRPHQAPEVAGPPSTAPTVPLDKRGNPTQGQPSTLGNAVSMLGGGVIRPKQRKRA